MTRLELMIALPAAIAVWTLAGLATWDAVKHSTADFHGLAGPR